MSIFARIGNSQTGLAIVEFYEPPPGVPITSCFHSTFIWADVTNFMPMPQIGWTATQVPGGYTFSAPAVPVLTLAAKATQMLGNGMSITSASSPGLDGTYSVQPDAQNRIAATAIYCQINSRFPGGVSALTWIDIHGAPHVFMSVASFMEFATKSADFVAALDEVILGASQTLPTLPVEMA